MVGRRKESVSVGIASGQSHCECQGEKDIEEQKSIMSPINLLSSGFIYFAAFPSTCSHTLFLPLQPLCFSKIMHCSILHVIIVETQERGRRGLETPKPSLSLGCQSYCCHLLLNNCKLYTCNISVN